MTLSLLKQTKKILLCQQKYINKTFWLFNSGIINTNKFHAQLKNNKEMRPTFSKTDKRKLIPTNPQASRYYSLITLQKVGNPIRSVLFPFSFSSHLVSQFVINIIKSYTGFIPNYSIKKSWSHDNAKCISFDLSNLFRSISPQTL